VSPLKANKNVSQLIYVNHHKQQTSNSIACPGVIPHSRSKLRIPSMSITAKIRKHQRPTAGIVLVSETSPTVQFETRKRYERTHLIYSPDIRSKLWLLNARPKRSSCHSLTKRKQGFAEIENQTEKPVCHNGTKLKGLHVSSLLWWVSLSSSSSTTETLQCA